MIGKLVVDYEEVSLGDLLEFLTDKGVECCVDGDNIYIYTCLLVSYLLNDIQTHQYLIFYP